jgi:hypothetical protein
MAQGRGRRFCSGDDFVRDVLFLAKMISESVFQDHPRRCASLPTSIWINRIQKAEFQSVSEKSDRPSRF